VTKKGDYNMALITWSDTLSVSIKEIDEQHKKLVTMVNELHSAMGAGKGKEMMGPILSGLVDYTKTHFATEEKYMQKYGYPKYLLHKSEHDNLTKQVIDLNTQYQAGKAVVTVTIMNFLKDWLTKHIQETDKMYSPFLNAKGVV
jgi:hemerythrin